MKIIIILIILGISTYLFFPFKGPMAIFPGLKGPIHQSKTSIETQTNYEKFSKGSNSRLAILLTDPNSNWLTLAHGLKTIGVPFVITRDPQTAFKHSVVLVYPIMSGKTFSEDAIKGMTTFVSAGGIVIGQHVLGGGLQDVFGLEKAVESQSRLLLNFNKAEVNKLIKFEDPLELTIPLGGAIKEYVLGTVGYTAKNASVIAKFDDGTGAVLFNKFKKGSAYSFGIDIGQLIHKGYSNRDESIARSYVNNYEPAIDVFLRIIREIYVQNNPGAVTMDTVPEGKSLTVILSHDIDYTKSLKNALIYAQSEKNLGVRGTFFLQTKYIRDYNDDIFFSPDHIEDVKRLSATGMEIGSHSVSHSKQFATFPLGDGMEYYPDYRPFVKNAKLTENGSVLGELRVSKFLIENVLAPGSAVSFRPGELSNPYSLPQALLATGFHYSSSVTSNNSLTHLPFQLTWGRNSLEELPIFEFPVTIEDEELPPLGDRIKPAIEIAEKLAKYGGTFVILAHPNILDHKLRFMLEFTKYWKGRAWFGSISDFGNWWAARNQVELDQEIKNNKQLIRLKAPVPIKGLVLRLARSWHPVSELPKGSVFESEKQRIILGNIQGNVDIKLEL